MDFYIGQILMFGGNFAPRGFALCDGSLLAISNYQALFSILGTTYGGDGRSTFALPDLRGRVPLHPGAGPGLTPRMLGQRGGEEAVTLTVDQMPHHNHTVGVNDGAGNSQAPANKVPAQSSKDADQYGDLPAPVVNTLDPNAVSMTGGGQAHDNMQPYTAVNFIICLEGIYPPRN